MQNWNSYNDKCRSRLQVRFISPGVSWKFAIFVEFAICLVYVLRGSAAIARCNYKVCIHDRRKVKKNRAERKGKQKSNVPVTKSNSRCNVRSEL